MNNIDAENRVLEYLEKHGHLDINEAFKVGLSKAELIEIGRRLQKEKKIRFADGDNAKMLFKK